MVSSLTSDSGSTRLRFDADTFRTVAVDEGSGDGADDSGATEGFRVARLGGISKPKEAWCYSVI